jgi:hypothetical protein
MLVRFVYVLERNTKRRHIELHPQNKLKLHCGALRTEIAAHKAIESARGHRLSKRLREAEERDAHAISGYACQQHTVKMDCISIVRLLLLLSTL